MPKNKIKSLIALIFMTINRQAEFHDCDSPSNYTDVMNLFYKLTSRISLLALGEVFSRNTLMATGIFTFSPSGAHTP